MKGGTYCGLMIFSSNQLMQMGMIVRVYCEETLHGLVSHAQMKEMISDKHEC